MEPHHIDTCPDSTCHPDVGTDVDPDSDFLCDADPDLTFHRDTDSDPDPDPSFKKRLKPLTKC